MAETTANPVSRRYLLVATSGVTAVGLVGASVPFVKSWNPSAKARALGAPIRADISKLQPGELLGPIPAWRGQPVFILHRSEAALEKLKNELEDLADPNSENDDIPEQLRNPWRSQRPEIGVYLGLCTHLGCSPKYYGKVEPTDFDPNWQGGFFCPCHGSKFDLAGRVAKNLPAPRNLVVPPYRFESDSVIVVGEHAEMA